MITNTMPYLAIVFLLFGAPGCRSDRQTSEVLIRANALHMEALATAEKVEHTLDSLRKSPGNANMGSELDSLQKLLELWEEGMIEVPGFAHEHHHGSHAHKPAPQMTEASMLEYQANAREAVLQLEKQLNEKFKTTTR
jgi:hypothetical protein